MTQESVKLYIIGLHALTEFFEAEKEKLPADKGKSYT
jgi:hypothetical protein